MLALFDISSMLTVLCLFICTFSYLKPTFPKFIDNRQEGFMGIAGKLAIIGERLSIYVSILCITLAFRTLFFR